MEIYTIGFTQKTAKQFFTILRNNNIKRLLDVRLNNVSQLAGFTKRDDLAFFLAEICRADYIHEPLLAPTQDMLDQYKKHKGPWTLYEEQFRSLMAERHIQDVLDRSMFRTPTALLCSEATPEHCHRRLVLEYLNGTWGDIQITHL